MKERRKKTKDTKPICAHAYDSDFVDSIGHISNEFTIIIACMRVVCEAVQLRHGNINSNTLINCTIYEVVALQKYKRLSYLITYIKLQMHLLLLLVLPAVPARHYLNANWALVHFYWPKSDINRKEKYTHTSDIFCSKLIRFEFFFSRNRRENERKEDGQRSASRVTLFYFFTQTINISDDKFPFDFPKECFSSVWEKKNAHIFSLLNENAIPKVREKKK